MKKNICVCFCDISKDFNRIWFKGLIHKCKEYGFKNKISDWHHNYLDNRKQRVALNNTNSAFLHVKGGVPQGSVLGPLLFLYINDISDNSFSAARLIADDSSIFATSSDIETIEYNIRVLVTTQ